MKTAWILPGGGAHSAYTAGACLAMRELGVSSPDIAIASSGSSGTMAYYLAGQYDSIQRIWCDLLSTRKFGNPLRFWKLMDVDYLVDQVVRIQEPLAVEKIYSTRTLFLVPMTESKTGELTYFSDRDHIDFFELLRFANTAPFFSGIFENKKLLVEGRRYFDTRVSSRPPKNIDKAIALGAHKIVVLDNYHPESSWTSGEFWYRAWLYTRSKQFRTLHREYLKEAPKLPDDVRIFHLRPRKPLMGAVWNNSKDKLTHSFDQGFKETIENKDFQEFVGL